MEASELTLIVHDEQTVRARSQDGAEVLGTLILPRLHRKMIGLFQDWLSLDRIKRRCELEVFGSILYSALFNGQVGAFFERMLAQARSSGRSLRVQLSFEEKAADLASIPWEYLYYEPASTFLATEANLVLSRYMPLSTGLQKLAPRVGPLRILIVVSMPDGLNLDPVIPDDVIDAIQKLAEKHPVQTNILNVPTLDNFLEKLEVYKPHVLHFIGHGQFDTVERKGQIALLASDESSAWWVSDDDFADFFEHMRSIPRLAFLHLCEGGVVDFRANFAGLAPKLVRKGVPAVVAMQHPISNNAAIIFSQLFYRELSQGKPVDIAVQNGRWRITHYIPGAYDNRVFGTPVLYMRSRDAVILPSSETVTPGSIEPEETRQ